MGAVCLSKRIGLAASSGFKVSIFGHFVVNHSSRKWISVTEAVFKKCSSRHFIRDFVNIVSIGVTGDKDVLMMLDVATRFLGVATVDGKDAQATRLAVEYFIDSAKIKLA